MFKSFSTLGICFVFLIATTYPVSEEAGEQVFSTKKKVSSDKGLYVTSWVAKTPKRFEQIKKLAKSRGLNTLVIDAKYDIEGQLIPIIKDKKLTPKTRVTASTWLKELADQVHKEGFILTARIVVFKDDHLVLARPDLSVKLPGNRMYRDHKGGRWANPYEPEVRLYNELLAEIAAMSGVDEVQFDYIRFPAEGEAGRLKFPEEKELSRVAVINTFLRDTRNRLAKYNVSIGVDIFGITAWEKSDYDIKTLGQSIEAMAEYIDVLSPMLYPSHFHRGFDGHAIPGEDPYYFISKGIERTQLLIKDRNVKIVPWIQGFAMETSWFGPKYISEQIRACRDNSVDRFLIWNARNVYDSVPSLQ
ncbi:MAG: putative glycoside hydrolase [Candidatus Margulisiibacteriota bacterium]|nr:putative glycoside hydrolase [Candidatus Margulisiibacteriota bacterium]